MHTYPHCILKITMQGTAYWLCALTNLPLLRLSEISTGFILQGDIADLKTSVLFSIDMLLIQLAPYALSVRSLPAVIHFNGFVP